MNNLTARQKFILNNIIEKGSLTLKSLSQQIDVSERTVSREISSINDWLKKYKIRISDRGGSLLIDGDKRNLDKVRELLGGIPLLWLLTQDQRQVLITAQLLLAKEPIKSAYFSYQFNVVEGTISFYLDKIENWLLLRNLELVRKRGYGLEIKGSDWNKGIAFEELLYNYKPMNELLSYLYEDNNDYSLITFFKVTFGENLISLTRELLKKLDDNNILKDNDVRYFGVFIHLLLAIKRAEGGSPIEMPDRMVSDILSLEEFSFINVVDKIFQESGIKLPENELAYLAIHLNGDKYVYKDNGEFGELGAELEDVVKEVVYAAGKRLNTKIICDSQLITGLIQHFSPALYRMTMGLQVWNPMINEIKEYYSDIFEAVDYACKIVFSKYNLTVPPNEVGYITMHIGAAVERQNKIENKLSALVICPSGIGTAKILYNKLKNNFPVLDRIDVCSLREMNEKVRDNYDLLLSTVNIDKNLYGNIIIVSPFLPKDDIEKIDGEIKRITDNKGSLAKMVLSMDELGNEESGEDFQIADNMLENFQLKNISADSLREVISGIANEVYNINGEISKERIEYLINKREEQGSVVIPGSHIALIHFRSEEIKAPFVGVYRLENFTKMKGIGFTSESVDTFLLMLARKNESNYLLELLGKISMSLVESKEFKETLRLVDIKDIRNELIRILNMEE